MKKLFSWIADIIHAHKVYFVVGAMGVIGAIGGLVAWQIKSSDLDAVAHASCGAAAAIVAYGASWVLHGQPRSSQAWVRLISPAGIGTATLVGIGGVSFCSSVVENQSLNNRIKKAIEANYQLDKKLVKAEEQVKAARLSLRTTVEQIAAAGPLPKTDIIKWRLERDIANLTPEDRPGVRKYEFIEASAETWTTLDSDGKVKTYPVYRGDDRPRLPKDGEKVQFARKDKSDLVLYELTSDGIEIEIKREELFPKKKDDTKQ